MLNPWCHGTTRNISKRIKKTIDFFRTYGHPISFQRLDNETSSQLERLAQLQKITIQFCPPAIRTLKGPFAHTRIILSQHCQPLLQIFHSVYGTNSCPKSKSVSIICFPTSPIPLCLLMLASVEDHMTSEHISLPLSAPKCSFMTNPPTEIHGQPMVFLVFILDLPSNIVAVFRHGLLSRSLFLSLIL